MKVNGLSLKNILGRLTWNLCSHRDISSHSSTAVICSAAARVCSAVARSAERYLEAMAALLSLALLSLATPALPFAPPRAASALSRDPPASCAAVLLLGSSSDENANGGAPQPPDDGLEQYSRCLSPVEARRSVRDELGSYSIIDSRKSLLGRIARGPARLLGRAVAGVAGRKGAKKPGSLILLRCGESEWTKTGRFTGWADPDRKCLMIATSEHFYVLEELKFSL